MRATSGRCNDQFHQLTVQLHYVHHQKLTAALNDCASMLCGCGVVAWGGRWSSLLEVWGEVCRMPRPWSCSETFGRDGTVIVDELVLWVTAAV
jgi:hypothetical protein